jgi:hypothetical protein
MTGATTTLTRERADLLESLAAAPVLPAVHRPRADRRAGAAAADRQRAEPRRADQARRGHRGGLGAVRRGRGRGDEPQLGPRRVDPALAPEPGETLAGVLADYEEVARRTDELVAAARPGRRPRAAGGTVVRAGRPLVGPAGVPAHHRGDRPARRPRRHPAGVDRRPEDDGLTRGDRDRLLHGPARLLQLPPAAFLGRPARLLAAVGRLLALPPALGRVATPWPGSLGRLLRARWRHQPQHRPAPVVPRPL